MKKKKFKGAFLLAMGVCSVALTGCSLNNNAKTSESMNESQYSQITKQETTTTTQKITLEDTNQGDFSIVTSDGAYHIEDGIYTIYKGGTYVLAGVLEGQICVCVTEANSDNSYDVLLELNGVTITYDKDSPIYILESTIDTVSYDVDISAQSGTKNFIKDERSKKSSDTDTLGSAAIYAETDIKIKGKGELYVTAGYNNGIHSKDDIEIKNLTLYVNSLNNAIKGNDSVSIESGNITAISTGGDGIKTTNTGLSSKGNQKGSINISGGEVNIYSCCDGIDAAYDVVISDSAIINIYTDTYSSYTEEVYELTSLTTILTGRPGGGPGGGGDSFGGGGFSDGGNKNKSSHSAKGIKSDNEIFITGGEIYIKAYDDGIHAKNDTLIESLGSYGVGSIHICGGKISIDASDDGIHAENTINIENDAYINITNSYEGIEGNQIVFNGGSTYVYASDDALNATTCGVSNTPAVYINDGYVDLDCASGDTDTLDSNGYVYIRGGITVLKNRQSSYSSMTGGTLDVDYSISLEGGILLSFGTWCSEANIQATKSSNSTIGSGTYYIKDSSSNIIATTLLEQNYAGYRLFNKTSTTFSLCTDSKNITSF